MRIDIAQMLLSYYRIRLAKWTHVISTIFSLDRNLTTHSTNRCASSQYKLAERYFACSCFFLLSRSLVCQFLYTFYSRLRRIYFYCSFIFTFFWFLSNGQFLYALFLTNLVKILIWVKQILSTIAYKTIWWYSNGGN